MTRKADPLTSKQLGVMSLMFHKPGISSREMLSLATDHNGGFHPEPVLNRLNKDCKSHPALARLGPPDEPGHRFGWYLTDYGRERFLAEGGEYIDARRSLALPRSSR